MVSSSVLAHPEKYFTGREERLRGRRNAPMVLDFSHDVYPDCCEEYEDDPDSEKHEDTFAELENSSGDGPIR